MPQMIELLEPGGFLMMETFLSTQRELGWGPTSDDHLLHPGELARLVAPLVVSARPRGGRGGRRRALAGGGERPGRKEVSPPLTRSNMQQSRPGRRVAIVAGVRTPFVKSGTAFRDVSAVALARHAARELLFRSEIDGREVDEVIFSQVVPSVLTPERRSRGESPPAAPAQRAGLHPEPRVRLVRAGDQQRRGPDRPRATPIPSWPAASSRSPTSRSCIPAASAGCWWTPAGPRASAGGWRPSAGPARATWCR